MKKIIKFIFMVWLFIGFNLTCHAQTNQIKIGDRIPDILVKIETPKYNYRTGLYKLTNATTNELVYCIEPGRTLTDGSYTVYNSLKDSPLTLSDDTWNYIQKLAYFGYGYKDHTDIKWYVATQMLIWNYILGDTGEVYYVNKNFERLNLYQEEEQAILNEVAKLNVLPSFASNDTSEPNYVVRGNQDLVLTDTNDVLTNYTVNTNNNNAQAITNNNQLIFNSQVCGGNILVTLRWTANVNQKPKIYYSPTSQAVMSRGAISGPVSFILVRVPWANVKLIKLASTSSNLSLKGAVFELHSYNGTYENTYETNELGEILIEDLPGVHYLQEVKAPYGFELNPEKFYFTVNTSTYDDILIKVENKPLIRNVQIEKYLEYLNGKFELESEATFELYQNNQFLTTFKTDAYGKANLKLEYGNYLIHQVTGQKGFLLSPDLAFTIDENYQDNSSFIIKNPQIKGQLIIKKIDAETKELIPYSATFKIKNIKTNEYLKIDNQEEFTTKKGILKLDNIAYGEYIIEEIKAPQGYLISLDNYHFTIDTNNQELTIEIPNQPQTGSLKIIKKGDDNTLLSDVTFNLYDANHNFLKELKTNADGQIFVENLRLGTYYLKEIAANNNYVLDKEEQQIIISKNAQVYELNLVNPKKTGSLKLIKKDKKTKQPLENVVFALYNAQKEFLGEYKTDVNGEIIIPKLAIGQYYIQEKTPLNNYRLDETLYPLEIKYDTEQIIELVNEKQTGTLIIEKRDSQTAKPLEGVIFQIFDEFYNLIYEGPTDINGQIIIENLEVGVYHLKEVLTREGYILNEEEINIALQANTQNKITINNRLKVITPKTGNIEGIASFLFSSVILIFGSWICNHDKKN